MCLSILMRLGHYFMNVLIDGDLQKRIGTYFFNPKQKSYYAGKGVKILIYSAKKVLLGTWSKIDHDSSRNFMQGVLTLHSTYNLFVLIILFDYQYIWDMIKNTEV